MNSKLEMNLRQFNRDVDKKLEHLEKAKLYLQNASSLYEEILKSNLPDRGFEVEVGHFDMTNTTIWLRKNHSGNAINTLGIVDISLKGIDVVSNTGTSITTFSHFDPLNEIIKFIEENIEYE
mgnify:CR=1 FL=1